MFLSTSNGFDSKNRILSCGEIFATANLQTLLCVCTMHLNIDTFLTQTILLTYSVRSKIRRHLCLLKKNTCIWCQSYLKSKSSVIPDLDLALFSLSLMEEEDWRWWWILLDGSSLSSWNCWIWWTALPWNVGTYGMGTIGSPNNVGGCSLTGVATGVSLKVNSGWSTYSSSK